MQSYMSCTFFSFSVSHHLFWSTAENCLANLKTKLNFSGSFIGIIFQPVSGRRLNEPRACKKLSLFDQFVLKSTRWRCVSTDKCDYVCTRQHFLLKLLSLFLYQADNTSRSACVPLLEAEKTHKCSAFCPSTGGLKPAACLYIHCSYSKGKVAVTLNKKSKSISLYPWHKLCYYLIHILTMRKKKWLKILHALFPIVKQQKQQTKECLPVWHEIAWKSVLQKRKSIFILYTRAEETDEFNLTFLLILTIWLGVKLFLFHCFSVSFNWGKKENAFIPEGRQFV